MKHALLAAVALAGLMEEASDTIGGSGAAPDPEATQPDTTAAEPAQAAPDVADTSGDTAGEPAGAHLDAPAAQADPQPEPAQAAAVVDEDDEIAVAASKGKHRVALVGKYSDRVPVQLKNQAHLTALVAEHGAASVELQGEGA